jgi:TIR domain
VQQWDLFISHATEDKEDAAIPLFAALERTGMTVWFDTHELKIGDSIREKIDSGLGACQYGVVILRPPFYRQAMAQTRVERAGQRHI